LLIVLWCLPSLSILSAHALLEIRKRNALHTDTVRAHTLGQHFVVGYSSFSDIVPLAEKGLIAGIYIAKHNIAGRRAEALRSEINVLQEKRRSAGLPPLVVAADQQGGIVSHLSPPLTALPSLSALADLPRDIRARKAEEFGGMHGCNREAFPRIGPCARGHAPFQR
jgi:beta-N-acetylhexosaminidase